MTRFARAKGSKSSNERTPEDSTPWDVMKEQLLKTKKENEDSKKREEAENQRLQNYQKFLQDQKVQKKKSSWCEFPETQSTSEPPTKKKKKDKSKKGSTENTNEIVTQINNTEDAAQSTSEPPTKKKNKKGSIANINEMQSNQNEEEVTLQKTKKKNKTKSTPNAIDKPSEHEGNVKMPIDNKKSKMKKEKKSNKLSEISNEQTVKSTQCDESNSFNSNNHVNANKGKKQKKKKPTKFVDGKPVRRKEINDRSFQLIINGKEVELVRFDGFPIMRKDAERLGELKNNMIKKGIPKSEVQRTMKLERRRAEKALARMKREVCYNCRKGGHNLSDCPDLKSKIPGVDAAEGVCFKCGSTEHKQFECKVQKDKEFKFATCFICKEPGHIARQCPDNPKGLYPNGGSCKLCGDVTHLRKDCPTVQDQREESSIKLQTLDNNIEDIGIKIKTETMRDTTKKPKKIKF